METHLYQKVCKINNYFWNSNGFVGKNNGLENVFNFYIYNQLQTIINNCKCLYEERAYINKLVVILPERNEKNKTWTN